jgi:hypothetical protein
MAPVTPSLRWSSFARSAHSDGAFVTRSTMASGSARHEGLDRDSIACGVGCSAQRFPSEAVFPSTACKVCRRFADFWPYFSASYRAEDG